MSWLIRGLGVAGLRGFRGETAFVHTLSAPGLSCPHGNSCSAKIHNMLSRYLGNRAAGTQEGFPGCRTPGEATGGLRINSELCARCRAASVADGDPQEYQLTRDHVRLQNQLESLLEEAHIKLSTSKNDETFVASASQSIDHP